MRTLPLTPLLLAAVLCSATAQAQAPNDPEIAACKATGLVALKERSPSVKDIILDMETLAISKANTKGLSGNKCMILSRSG